MSKFQIPVSPRLSQAIENIGFLWGGGVDAQAKASQRGAYSQGIRDAVGGQQWLKTVLENQQLEEDARQRQGGIDFLKQNGQEHPDYKFWRNFVLGGAKNASAVADSSMKAFNEYQRSEALKRLSTMLPNDPLYIATRGLAEVGAGHINDYVTGVNNSAAGVPLRMGMANLTAPDSTAKPTANDINAFIEWAKGNAYKPYTPVAQTGQVINQATGDITLGSAPLWGLTQQDANSKAQLNKSQIGANLARAYLSNKQAEAQQTQAAFNKQKIQLMQKGMEDGTYFNGRPLTASALRQNQEIDAAKVAIKDVPARELEDALNAPFPSLKQRALVDLWKLSQRMKLGGGELMPFVSVYNNPSVKVYDEP